MIGVYNEMFCIMFDRSENLILILNGILDIAFLNNAGPSF